MTVPNGICLAPADYALAPDPAWVRIDTTYRVQQWSIDRGRQNEMSRTDTGTARVELVDRVGAFDPTNPTSPFYGQAPSKPSDPMGPLVQAAIAIQNPVTSAWSTLFRGFISSIRWEPYQTKAFANVTLDLVDALAIFNAAEMPLDGTFGDDASDGNIVFAAKPTTHGVQDRINDVLDMAGWDPTLRSIFTGNVKLQATTYAPRSTVAQVMQDAADGEFPDVANIYIGGPRNPGKVVFHGRLARFNPADVSYNIQTWQAGDDAAAAVSPSTVVRISPPLTASLDDTLLYTSALAMPQAPPGSDYTSADYTGNTVEDTLAVATKGLRTWSAENLTTAGGLATNGKQETKLFADYIRDNYPTPRVRVGQLTIKPRRPASTNGPATWALLCGIDISDIVHLKTTHVGGGGFDTDFYVEGIHYTCTPGPGDFPLLELVLDVSPRGYYDSNPFA